jgi:8-amino-7-oxononanoate synthase
MIATVQRNPAISAALARGIIHVPLLEDWNDRDYQTHIFPIRTRNQYSMYLAFHLILAGFTAFFAEYPTVPKGQSRVRLSLHACNTVHEIDALIQVIGEWAEEMMQIENNDMNSLPRAVQIVLKRVEELDLTEL